MLRPSHTIQGPLVRRFDAAAARDGGTPFRVDATAAERDALATDCGLPGIDALSADLLVEREGAEGLRVTGSVVARVRQVCVVSLDEFASDIDEPLDVSFAPEAEVDALAAAHAARAPGADDEEAEDLPDPIVGGRIDLGALVAEVLVLGLDPYPRKPGVAFSEPVAAEPAASPFAVLRDLKRPDGP